MQTSIAELQVRYFSRLTYAERITRCDRPENVDGPTAEAWTISAETEAAGIKQGNYVQRTVLACATAASDCCR